MREHLGSDVPLLFTPNFCHIEEYQLAFDAGADVTIDGPAVLLQRPEVSGVFTLVHALLDEAHLKTAH